MSSTWPTLQLIITVSYQIVSTSLQKKETRKQAKSVKVLTKMVCRVLKYAQSIKTKLLQFSTHSFHPNLISFQPRFTNYSLKYNQQIFFYSCTCLCRVQQVPSFRLQVTAGQDLMNSDQTECDIWSLLGPKYITPQEQEIQPATTKNLLHISLLLTPLGFESQ